MSYDKLYIDDILEEMTDSGYEYRESFIKGLENFNKEYLSHGFNSDFFFLESFETKARAVENSEGMFVSFYLFPVYTMVRYSSDYKLKYKDNKVIISGKKWTNIKPAFPLISVRIGWKESDTYADYFNISLELDYDEGYEKEGMFYGTGSPSYGVRSWSKYKKYKEVNYNDIPLTELDLYISKIANRFIDLINSKMVDKGFIQKLYSLIDDDYHLPCYEVHYKDSFSEAQKRVKDISNGSIELENKPLPLIENVKAKVFDKKEVSDLIKQAINASLK